MSHKLRYFLITLAVVAGVIVAVFLFSGATSLCWANSDHCQDINRFRANHDRPGLEQRARLQDDARDYSRILARTRILKHDTIGYGGEIIGFGPDWETIFKAWKRSSCKPGGTYEGPCPGHRELLLDRDFTRVGLGCTRDGLGTFWCVVRFR